MKKLLAVAIIGCFCFTVSAQSRKMSPPPPPPAPTMETMEVPPPPPPPPPIYKNKQGYTISVWNNNGNETVIVKKRGFVKKITLKEWEKNKTKYEKMYGKVPPPPPVIEEVIFTPPVIKRDN